MTTDIALIDISTQPIELCKLLKIANMVSGGGEAKIVISQGFVVLNDEVEFQKRKKVYQDDIIEFNGETIQVNVAKKSLNLSAKQVKTSKATSQNNNAHKQTTRKVKKQAPRSSESDQNTYNESSRSKRKPISF